MRRVPRCFLILAMGAGTAGAQRTTAAPPAHAVDSTASGSRIITPEAEVLRRRVDVIEGRTVNSTGLRLAGPRTLGETLMTSSDEQTTYLLVHRTTSSQPEVHARWDDLVIVRSGTGTIQLGDSLVGSSYRAPGERIGGQITGRFPLVVHAGDIVRIPAAVPHAFLVAPGEWLDYLVIKQRRQRLPIRWAGEP